MMEEKQFWTHMLHYAEDGVLIKRQFMQWFPEDRAITRLWLNIHRMDVKKAQLRLARINDNDEWIRWWEDDYKKVEAWRQARQEAYEKIKALTHEGE